MNDKNSIENAVVAAVKSAYPDFPVRVQESPEDSTTLWVRVFAVPTDQVRPVKNFIHRLQDEIVASSAVLLLPMVKNLETTRQHYPEYMPPESAVPVSKMVEQFFLETVRQPSEWQPATCGAMYAADYRAAPARFGFDMGKITGGQLTPAPIYENAVSANKEIALAA